MQCFDIFLGAWSSFLSKTWLLLLVVNEPVVKQLYKNEPRLVLFQCINNNV